VKVDVHPTLETQKLFTLRERRSFDEVRIYVARHQPGVLLCRNRLYMHEYVTHPPLRELRICLREYEGTLLDGEVVFVVS
jgi:hypothetical protein